MDEAERGARTLENCVADGLAFEFGAQCGFNSARRCLSPALFAAFVFQVAFIFASAFAQAPAQDGRAAVAGFRRDGLGDGQEQDEAQVRGAC